MNQKAILFILISLIFSVDVFSQVIESIEFRNQSISDILLVLSELGGHSIIPDETVSGSASYYFHNVEFEEALTLFLSSNEYYFVKDGNVYYVSKIDISFDSHTGQVNIHTEDTDIHLLLRALSRSIEKTIFFDALPREKISIHSNDMDPKEILEMILIKYPEYYLETDENYFSIKRNSAHDSLTSNRSDTDLFILENNLYSADFKQIRFREALSTLFDIAGIEHSFLGRNDILIERFEFSGKSFDQILRLLLEQGNGDYKVIDGIYYVVDIERRDVLKKFYTTVYLPLKQTAVSDVMSLIPSDIGSSNNIKVDKNNNALILSGTLEEVAPIQEFVNMLDNQVSDMVYHRFQLSNLDASAVNGLIPKEYQFSQPVVLKESNSFIMLLPPAMIDEFSRYIGLIDVDSKGYAVELRYIKAEQLMENPPPSVRREELIATNNSNILYFKGSEMRYKALINDLELLDRPIPQIRYEVLVMQIQEVDKKNWDINLGNSLAGDGAETSLLGTLGNVLNLNFDIISQFGYQFALDLNWSMENSESKVMADTSLNALSGESTHFQNTETYRYQETEIDPDTGEPTSSGVTREITSGLIVEIEGWSSGDGMITMDVKTTISKRDDTSASNSTSIPTTTERSVNTHIRTESGKPVIIGGLMQQDKVIGKQKTPLLGDLPLLGKLFQSDVESYQDTEMVVTIVPYLEYPEYSINDVERDMESLYNRFIRR